MAAPGNTQLELSDRDRARLEGAEGPALQLAMRLIVRAGENLGAERLIDVGFAHIDTCHYSGPAHLDFAEFPGEADASIAAGAMVAAGRYGREVPVVVLAPEEFGRLRTGDHLTVARDGRVTITQS